MFSESDVRSIMAQTGQKLGIAPNVAANVTIKFSCAKSFYGQAQRKRYFSTNTHQDVIKISRPLMLVRPEAETIQTIVHEFCHIADAELNGRMDGHQANWKSLMRMAGYPNAKACGPLLGDVIIPGMVTVRCPCKTHQVTKNLATRMQNGRKYRCPACKGLVKSENFS